MAVKIEQLASIPVTGQGAPDYRPQVHAAVQRAGYQLDYNQTLVLFFLAPLGVRLGASPYPWVTAPLAPGAMAHLIESSTGLPMPYVIPAGYSLEMVEKDWDSSENMGFWLFFDGFPAAAAGQNQANTLTGINTVVSYNTLWFDPTSALPHTIDMLVENFDPMNALEGGISFPTLLTERGTPPLPAVKTVRCHHCGKNIPGVPRFQDNVVCPHCAGQILLITPRPPTARKGA